MVAGAGTTPNYSLIRGAEPTSVVVKPLDRLDDPKVAETITWVRETVVSSGWVFEVASEPPQPFLNNVRFLAGYRRPQMISPEFWMSCELCDSTAWPLAPWFAAQAGPSRWFGPRMLWSHAIDADLSDVLSDKTVLVSRAAA